MELGEKLERGWRRSTEGLLIFAVLLGFGFFINREVELKGLYMDDLYLWSCYGEQSFMEYVFPMGGSRFRFVFYLASWLELLFLGGHVEWLAPFNILLNSLIAFSIYRMCLSFSSGRKAVSLVLALVFLSSRMAYYQIGQFYGLMESLGLWAAVGILYFLYRYMNERNSVSYLYGCLLYFLASFIHERYMALLPALLLALALAPKRRGSKRYEDGRRGSLKKAGWEEEDDGENARETVRETAQETARGRSRGRGNGRDRSFAAAESELPKWQLFLVTLLVFGAIQAIRFLTIGTLAPAGTGGTEVADTFSLADSISHAWEQAAFVFGRNSGPDYLCILPYEDSPDGIRLLILLSNLVLFAAVALFAVCAVRDRSRLLAHLKNAALFLVFIAMCIGSSSVTIRVEMRWVYVVFALALLFFSYMSSVMGRAGALVFLYAALAVPAENFYRDHWDNLYLWPEQAKYNSLAEQTIEKYGQEIFEKEVYIIGNTYEMSEFTAETFLKVYDREGSYDGRSIQFIDSDFDFKELSEDMVILAEDPEHNAYQDVTDFVKKQRLNYAYGSYEDGWVDEHAKIVFMNGERDQVTLSCYYPGTVTGDQVCQVTVNGKRMPDLVFTDQNMTYEIPSAPYQMIELELSCNFYVANAKETRGEEKLAMIVTINAE